MITNPPKDPKDFFQWLKNESEAFWENVELKPQIYGYQTQRGTKWGKALTEMEIAEYEAELGFKFPLVYVQYLKVLNGTDLPGINVYGRSGEPLSFAENFYAYPRDIEKVKELIGWICDSFKIKVSDIDGNSIPFIIPIVGHRFLVVDKAQTNPVLSMYGNDVIPYASSLPSFLVSEIFHDHAREADLKEVQVNFWLD